MSCPTCGGRDGAHYLCCIPNRVAERVLAPVLTRLLGSGYRWTAPAAPSIAPAPQVLEGFSVEQVKAITAAAVAQARRAAETAPLTVAEAVEEFDTDDSYPDHGPADDAAAATGRPSRTVGDWEDDLPPEQPLLNPAPAEAPAARSTTTRQQRVAEAGEWLTGYLTEHGGSTFHSELLAAARAAGYSDSTLRTARGRVGVELRALNTFPRRTYWTLPGAEAPPLPARAPGKQAVALQVPIDTASAPLPPPQPRPRTRSADDRRREMVAERAAALDLFVSEHVATTEDRTAYVTAPQLLAAYEAWRPHLDAPAAFPSDIGYAMRRAGIWGDRRRQARRTDVAPDGQPFGNRTKPMLYLGATLKPVATTQPPAAATTEEQPSEPPTEPVTAEADARRRNAQDVAELRRLTRLAQRATGPRVLRPAYTGDLPGRELKDDRYRQIVLDVIDHNPGARYEKRNANGNGKPRLILPDGRVRGLANTPSDVRSHLYLRRDLRHMGVQGV